MVATLDLRGLGHPLTAEAQQHAANIAAYLHTAQPARAAAHVEAAHMKTAGIVEWGEKNFYWSDTDGTKLIKFLPHQVAIMELFFNPEIAQLLGCKPNFQTLVYSTVKKSGKGLALDTLLPTPTGWVRMGAVREGTILLDAQGQPTTVTYMSPVRNDLDCYKVSFSDGTYVIADQDHQWVVEALPKYKSQVLTTPQIKDTLWRKDGACNYRVRNAPPLELPSVQLPIDPYVLGAWLGDGTSATGIITVGDEDLSASVTEMYRAGYEVTLVHNVNDMKAAQYRVAGLHSLLGDANLLDNKHIPSAYLRASREQRIALMQGLMDTDGYINQDKYGEYEISQASQRLSLDIMELARTLGLSPTYKDDASKLYGVYVGRRYRVRFHAPTFETFRLPRKLSLQKLDEAYRGKRTDRARTRRIVDISAYPTVPTRCVQVDSPSHTYLCGEGMVPTHNTAIAALVARWITETWGSHAEVYTLANDMEQARGRIYAAALASIELDPRYARADKGIANLWRIIEREAAFLPTHSTLKAVSSDYKGEAGSNPTATLWSELWGYNSEASQRLWEELTPVPTRPRSIRYVETYAGYENESGILNDLEDRLKDPRSGSRRLTKDELIWLGLDWPFPEEDETPFYIHAQTRTIAYWDSGEVARRMPWQTPEYYAAQEGELRRAQFDRLHKNIRVSAAGEFIPIEWWDRLDMTSGLYNGQESIPPLDTRTPIVIGADASVSGDCTAIVGVSRDPRAGRHEDAAVRVFRSWEPDGGPLDYTRTIEPQLLQWCTGHIHWPHEDCATHSKLAVLGPCTPVPAYNVVGIVYDQYQLHDLMTRIRNASIAWCKPFNQQGDRMIADKALYDLIRDARIHHMGDHTLRDHIQGCAAKIPPGDNSRLRLVKKGTASKIDGAVALSMASHETLRLIL